MFTVKQLLEKGQMKITDQLDYLAEEGLFESKRINLVKRAMTKNPNTLTLAESSALNEFVESLTAYVISEKQDHLSKLDRRISKKYPSDRDMPTIIILKRKAIRVYPDNQKIALYYSQALDRYISIPFGNNGEPLGMVMKEEAEQVDEISQELATRAYAKRYRQQRDLENISSEVDDSLKPALKNQIAKVKRKRELLARRLLTQPRSNNPKKPLRTWAGPAALSGAKDLARSGKDLSPSPKPNPYMPPPEVAARGIALGSAPYAVGVLAGQGIAAAYKGVRGLFKENLENLREQGYSKPEDVPVLEPPKIFGLDPLDVIGAFTPVGRAVSIGKSIAKYALRKFRNRKSKGSNVGKAAGAGAGAGALAGALSGKKSDQSDKPFKRRLDPNVHNFSQAGRLNVSMENPRKSGVPGKAEADYLNKLYGTSSQTVTQQPYGIYESFDINTVARLSRNKRRNDIQFKLLDENVITINKGTAKKIIKVYNSLNEENKKKMENMLSESSTSFTKALNFILRH